MNESPWQPPTEPDPERMSEPTLPDRSPEPSPWSPEGEAASTRSAPTDPAPASPPPGASAPDGMLDAAVPPPARRRSKVVVAGVVAAVVALGVAGLFAVQRFTTEEAGGSASPDQLGLDLMAAMEAEDMLGMIDTMLPGERESLGEPFVEMVGELQRIEILSADTDLSRLLGLDLELTEEVVQVLGTNVPDIATVKMEAAASITLDGSTLPLGSFLEELLPEDAITELRGTRLTESDDFELELTAVQHDDRWYFSVFHTVAEIARDESAAGPIPEEGIVASGGDSPEAAVDRLLDAVEQLDLSGIIAVLDPAEAAALQRYAPLFIDDADAELAEVPLEWRIDVRDFRVEGDGGQRTVFVDAIGVTGEAEGITFRFAFEGDCVRGEFDGESFEECGGATDAELESILADAPAVEAFVASVEEAFADFEPVGIELRERDGAWFVSPLATSSEAMLAVVRALDRSEIDTLVTDGEAAFEEIVDLFLGGFGFDDDILDDGLFDDDILDDGMSDGGMSDGDTALNLCYEEPTAAGALACFETAVAAGEIEPFEVPTVLAYPECGLAEIWWEGGLWSASDEEFAAALDVAVPCFGALVDSGELDEWMMPFEVEHADCFEGRNWYNEYDDDAYLARVDACIYGD